MNGVVDSGSDITILGGEMFKKVASVARLRKKDFQPPDKTLRNYDQQPFTVDGRIDIDVAFQDKTMKTTVYVKMDAPKDLLLSEGVCRQLGILTYYPEVQPLRIRRGEKTSEKSTETKETDCQVSMVRVRLVQGLQLLPGQSMPVEVELSCQELKDTHCSLLFEPSTGEEQNTCGGWPAERGTAILLVVNHLGFTQELEKGTELGGVAPAEMVDATITDVVNCRGITQESELDV